MPHATEADLEQTAPAPQHGMASEADVLPEQSLGAAAQEYGRKMNPVSMAQGIAQNVYHPIEAVKRWGDVNNRILSNVEDAAKRGDYTEAAAHALHYVLNGIPGLGEALDEAGTKIRQGDTSGGLADTAALATQIVAGAKAPAIAKGIGTAGQYAGAATKAAAPGVLGGMAKAGAGEVLAKLPGMELPARFGLQYPALRQVAKAIEKGHEAGMKAIAPKEAAAPAPAAAAASQGPIRASSAPSATAPPSEAPPAPEARPAALGKTAADLLNEEMPAREAAPAEAKAPGQTLAESHGEKWGKLSEDDKLAYAQLEGAQASSEARNAGGPSAFAPRPPEYYGVKPAETPPTNPAPSAPATSAPAEPAPAAPSTAQTAPPAKVQPIRPEEPQTAADIAKAQFAQAKADRFVKAIQDYNAKFNAQPITADSIADLDDSAKGVLARALSGNGLLPKVDANKFPNTSWPYIVTKLRQAEYSSR